MDLDTSHPDPSYGAPLYLPVHRSCLDLVTVFLSSSAATSVYIGVERPEGSVTSLKQLWEVLYRRVPWNMYGQTWGLPEPHSYFAGRGKEEVRSATLSKLV